MTAPSRLTPASAVLLGLLACAAPPLPTGAPPPSSPDADSVAALTDPEGCALVFGLNGTISENRQANESLEVINRVLTDELVEFLAKSGYPVEKVFVGPGEQAGEEGGVRALREMYRFRCSRLVQVAGFIEGPADGRRIEFRVSVFRPTPGERIGTRRQFRMTGAFERSYSYPLTMESLRTLQPSDVASRIGTDLAESGSLAKREGAP